MSIAFVTMCADDHIWLAKWVDHNEPHVQNRSDLHVILDGEDEVARDIAKGCSVIVVPRLNDGGSFEKRRMRMIHSYVAGLLWYYKVVVFNDVDEYLCIHPDAKQSLTERLLDPKQTCKVVSPVGVELLYQDDDDDLDVSQPLLGQRPMGFLNSGYCKPCMFYQPIEKGNQHVIRGEPWVIDTDIFLFHCRYIDKKMLARRILARKELLEDGMANGAGGWERDAAIEKFKKQKNKFLSAPEQELNAENCQVFIDMVLRRYSNGKGAGERTFGRFRVPQSMTTAL